MTTITTLKPIDNIVKSMRQIRDEISEEIKDMTFAEERAFLDKLLKVEKSENNGQKQSDKKSASAK